MSGLETRAGRLLTNGLIRLQILETIKYCKRERNENVTIIKPGILEGVKRIPIKMVAQIIGKPLKETRRWIVKNNCGEKEGRFWFVSIDKFLANFRHLTAATEDAEDYTDARPTGNR